MPEIAFRDAITWRGQMTPQDRETVDRLQNKYVAGEDLSEAEERELQRIVAAAKRNVHGEAAERRLHRAQTTDELMAEFDKFIERPAPP